MIYLARLTLPHKKPKTLLCLSCPVPLSQRATMTQRRTREEEDYNFDFQQEFSEDNNELVAKYLFSLQFKKLEMNEAKKLKETVKWVSENFNLDPFEQSQDSAKGSEEKKRINKKIVSSHEEKDSTILLVDGYFPPNIPPIPSLNGLIKSIGKPFVKQLTRSDVKDDLGRLSFSKTHVEECVLPLLKREDGDLVKGIPVKVFDQDGFDYSMTFKLWAKKFYVLTCGWRTFYEAHQLRKLEDFITVWLFRHAISDKLCFFINSRRLPVFETVKKRRA